VSKIKGLGDYLEQSFSHQAPGSRRPLPPSTQEGVLPGQHPVGVPEDVPFKWVKEVTFDTWEAYAFLVTAVAAIRLDAPQFLRRGRRAVLLINSDVANAVWIGHSGSVAINNGCFLASGGGAISLPLSEKAQIWAIGAGPAIVSIVQFA